MTILKAILFSVEAICSILLIGIILIQKAKGGGLGVAFGAGGGESLFGSRAGNVLTKATVILAIIFMVNTVALAIMFARSHEETLMDGHMGVVEPVPVPTQPVDQTSPGEAVLDEGFDAGSPSPSPVLIEETP